MRRFSFRSKSLAACGLAIGIGLCAVPATASASSSSAPSLQVAAAHLNNPRGLAVSADGVLYFAEAGRGSNNHCDPSGQNCVGLTSSIDMLGAHGVTRIVTGLISAASQGGVAAEGLVAVSTSGNNVYGVFGGNTSSIPPSGFPAYLVSAARKELGQVGVVSGSSFDEQAPVGDFDYRWAGNHKYLNPQQFPDSNPNGVLALGGVRYVADAGANTLDQVDANGTIHVLTYFPVPSNSPTDSVPTCVAQGPDGALYVGELLGGSFAPGHARVWRVSIKNGKVTKSVWATGLTTVQGCGFDRWGNFYATEFETHGLGEGPSANPAGALVKIAPNGTRTMIGVGQLFVPSGFAARADGTLYVSNCSIAPGTGFGPCADGGEIIRIK